MVFSCQFSVVSQKRKICKWLTLFSRLCPNEFSIVRHCAVHGWGKPCPHKIVQRRLAGCGGLLSVAGTGLVDDGGADEVAPFGPGTVVVAHLVEAQQILEDE